MEEEMKYSKGSKHSTKTSKQGKVHEKTSMKNILTTISTLQDKQTRISLSERVVKKDSAISSHDKVLMPSSYSLIHFDLISIKKH
jgi:hypothetical protein